MDTSDHTQLLRYLEDDLSSEERARLETRLQREADLRNKLDRLRAVRSRVQNTPRTFARGFSERVMARIQERQADPFAALYEPIRIYFLRLALAVLLLIGGVGTYNIVQYQDTGATNSPIEAALGLPEVTYQTSLQSEWSLTTEVEPD